MLYKVSYKNPGHPTKELVIDIAAVKMTIDDRSLLRQSPSYKKIYNTANTIIDGTFWDHVKPICDGDLKLTAFHERFMLGMEWKDTSLFRSYKEQLLERGKVQGCHDFDELINLYEEQHDILYQKLAAEGVKSARWNVDISPIYVYINKGGEFVYTSGGNHRLNMAKVLGFKTIPVRVRGRHVGWQRIRDELHILGFEEFIKKYPSFAHHPDLEL